MSWQEYVDDHLLCQLQNGGTLKHAAIVGQDGGVWAQDPEFPPISPEDVESLVKGFDDPSELAGNGIWLGGTKYLMIAGEPGAVIRGRGKENKQAGVTVKKTTTALVIGIYDEGVQPADCNLVVENLGDYLSGQGI
jgi:profilin